MSKITSFFAALYAKLLVWLGAEPPEGYEHLLGEPELPAQYTLKEGETLFSVARKFGVNYQLIAKRNGIEQLDAVTPGQTITIPAPDWQPPPEQPVPSPEDTEQIEKIEDIEETEEIREIPPTQPEPAELPEPAEEVGEEEPPEETEPEAPAPVQEEEAPPAPSEEPQPTQEQFPEFEAEPAPTQEEAAFRYEVQRGDTLSAIARRYGLTVQQLIEANDIADATRMAPGQKLIIPGYMEPKPEPEPEPPPPAKPPVPDDDQFVYTVTSGDTLNAIAKRYNITLRDLINVNNLDESARLHVGQKLMIPGVLKPPPPKPAETVAPEVEPPAEAPGLAPLGPPTATRALYVSYFAIGHPQSRERVFQLLSSTELNTVVIDAKGDFGLISYPTGVGLAKEIGAARPTAKDFSEIMSRLKEQNIYTIARIVAFKDNPLAKSHPELAAKTKQGAVWQDRDDQAWVDPFLRPVWDYNIEVATEAAQLGFDEIQFDYVRFPTASQSGAPKFSQNLTVETRVAAVTGFLSAARGHLRPLGVKLSAGVFGYTCWRTDDTIIGQDIERMSRYLDVLCPMLYPSTFGSGIPGYKNAVAHPYEVVHESARRAVKRVAPHGCAVRPWIQDFQDYRFDRRTYGPEEIRAQIKGCFDAGSEGFSVWDPNVTYTDNAYAPVAVVS